MPAWSARPGGRVGKSAVGGGTPGFQSLEARAGVSPCFFKFQGPFGFCRKVIKAGQRAGVWGGAQAGEAMR
jgi:hypothetical protein